MARKTGAKGSQDKREDGGSEGSAAASTEEALAESDHLPESGFPTAVTTGRTGNRHRRGTQTQTVGEETATRKATA